MKKFLLSLAVLFAGPLAADTVVCPDGSVKWLSPFNPTPCVVVVKNDSNLPENFEKIYGKKPVDIFAAVTWEQNLRFFLFAESVKDPAKSVFEAWGLPEAWFVHFKNGGSVLRFKDGTEFDSKFSEFAHVVVAVFQFQEIQKGKFPAKVHPFVFNTLEAAKHDQK